MLSIFSSKYKKLDDMVDDHRLSYHRDIFYHPSEFIPLTCMTFRPTDLYQLFLIDLSMYYVPVQHFVVVVKRLITRGGHRASDIIFSPPRFEYYSMGFGSGPDGSYVLESPDPGFRTINKIKEYADHALPSTPQFTPLGHYADKLNELTSSYKKGGFLRHRQSTGYFAVHSFKKYSVTGDMCLTGFDSIFPVPTDKLHSLERICFFAATGKKPCRHTRKRRKISRE